MNLRKFVFMLMAVTFFWSCQKTNDLTEESQATTETVLTAERRGLDGKNYGLRKVEEEVTYYLYPPGTEPLVEVYPDYSAAGPIFRKTSIKSRASREGRPDIEWDARINYNSNKIVFISNIDNDDEDASFLPVVPAGDTIVFASLKNGRIDYSRAGKLNGYYSKMQYYYNWRGQLSRIVNWSLVPYYGYRVFDFRFTYDNYGNLLSWKDISSHNIGGITYTYDYSRPVKNAYYREFRPFIEPVFTIMDQFGLFESMRPKHLRTSAESISYHFPEFIHLDYSHQVIDAAGNLVQYSEYDENKYKITWESW